MNIDSVSRLACTQLQEDFEYMGFWTRAEMAQYAVEGLMDIIDKTKLIQTTRAIPLFACVDNGDTFAGDYYVPALDIQKISDVYWKDSSGVMQRLETRTIRQMDMYDGDWRNTTGEPRFAILSAGDFTTMGIDRTFKNSAIKIRLYPIPTTYATDFTSDLLNFDIGSGGGYGGYGGYENLTTDNSVRGLDLDDDGLSDTGISNLSPAQDGYGIMIGAIGTIQASDVGNIPYINYDPDLSKTLRYNLIVGQVDLDTFPVPYKLQLALRDYITYRCFDKEGEAQDEAKAFKYKGRYEEIVSDYRAENYLFTQETIVPNRHFGLKRRCDLNPNGSKIW